MSKDPIAAPAAVRAPRVEKDDRIQESRGQADLGEGMRREDVGPDFGAQKFDGLRKLTEFGASLISLTTGSLGIPVR